MNFARIAANVAGAGLGLWAFQSFVAPILPTALYAERVSTGLDTSDFVDGAVALAGAYVGNTVYNKIAGK